MLTPIAASGSRDNIPQAQADAQDNWFCSIENGFPDITMQASNLGGQPPRGQGANGLFYLSSDQRVFLQNGGVITFEQAVSDLIGGYPAGAVLDYIADNTFVKVQSLIDDNTNNFVQNPSYIDGVRWQKITNAGLTSLIVDYEDVELPIPIDADTISIKNLYGQDENTGLITKLNFSDNS